MEFKLNKIDTEIRQKIQDNTKEGLIHRKQEVKINKDTNKDKRDRDFSNQLKKYSKKKSDKNKKISIEAEKINEVDVEAFIYEDDKENLSSGRFLDLKR